MSSTRSKNWIVPLSVVVVLAAAVIAAIFLVRGDRATDAPPAQRPLPPVEVAQVQLVTLEETVRGIGTLRANASVEIRPEVAGRIRAIRFEEGTTVEQGQVLFEIDDDKLQTQLKARQAALRAAEVRLENAQRNLERQQRLFERGIVPEDELDRIKMELDMAAADLQRFAAEVALTEEQLGDTIIPAPFTGEITSRNVDVGAFVSVGDVLTTLLQIDPLEVTFAVPERHLGRIERGQTAQVSTAAYPQQTFDATVTFVSPFVHTATRTFEVRATIQNPRRMLLPGAFATVLVTVGVRENRPVVPEESLVATRTGYIIFIVEDRTVRSVEVQTGLRRDGMVELLQGPPVGAQVVRAGHLRLRGGESVRVLDPAPTGLAGPEPPRPAVAGDTQ